MWYAVSVVCQLWVWPHGLTDLWQHPISDVLMCYGPSFLVALAAPILLPVFLLAAIVHLGVDDGNVGVAAVVVSTLTACIVLHVGEAVMAMYMICYHVPKHYHRVRPSKHTWLALAGLGALCCGFNFDPYEFKRATTACVLGHTVVGVAGAKRHTA